MPCGSASADPGDVELIRGWVAKTRIRWGKDADCRSRDGLPPAMTIPGRRGSNDCCSGMPCPATGTCSVRHAALRTGEGAPAQALGRFAHFMSALFSLSSRLQHEKTLSEWSQVLQDMLAGFFLPDSDDDEARMLDEARQACAELGRLQELAVFTGALTLEIVRDILKRPFRCAPRPRVSDRRGNGLRHAAHAQHTFRIICLVGMNDGAFPRPSGRRPLI